jgi:hypothetical protein
VHDMTHWARPVTPAVVASFEARCAAFTVADLRAALLRLGFKAPAARLRKRDLVLDLVRAALARAASVVDDPIVDADLLPAATPPPVAASASVSVSATLPPVLNLAAHVDADDDDATWSLGASQRERGDVNEPTNGADVDDVSEKLQALQLAWDGSMAADSRESLHLPLPTSQFHELLNKHVLNNNTTTITNKTSNIDSTVSSIAACAPMYSDSFAPHQPQDDDVSTSRGDAGDNDEEPTVPLQLTPATPDTLVLRRGATTLLTPYQGADVKRVSSGKLDGVVLPPSDPEQSGDDDDDDEPVFNDSPTVLLTDAARARLRDEQSRGTSSATALSAKPSITARIVVVADTASAGLPHDERDSLPVSRYFPALRAGEAAASPPHNAPTDFQSGRRVLLLNSGAPPAFAMSSVAQPFVAPRRAAVVFPTPADESRHSSTAAATAAPAPAATVWKARHQPVTARAGNAPLAATALGASTTTSSGSPDAPTVELRLSDRELLLRAASIEVPQPATTQRALLFKSHSSNTVSSVSAKSDDMCKPIHVSHGTDSSDESGRLHTADDDTETDDDDDAAEEDGDEDDEWAQFASASSPPPATPLRRRARRRSRGSRGQRRKLPPSPLRRSLTADEAVAVAPTASAPKLGKLTTPALVAFSGDWRALRDSDGQLIWLHLPTGVVQFSAPDEKQQQQMQRSRRGGSFV